MEKTEISQWWIRFGYFTTGLLIKFGCPILRPVRLQRLQRFLKAQKSLMKISESSKFLNSAYLDVFLMFKKRKFFGRIMKYQVEF